MESWVVIIQWKPGVSQKFTKIFDHYNDLDPTLAV